MAPTATAQKEAPLDGVESAVAVPVLPLYRGSKVVRIDDYLARTREQEMLAAYKRALAIIAANPGYYTGGRPDADGQPHVYLNPEMWEYGPAGLDLVGRTNNKKYYGSNGKGA